MTLPNLSLAAPAKLNLFLHINGRRDDGYHELQTLFQLIDLTDHLHFSVGQGTEITVTADTALGIASEDNLVYRAAKLLQPFAGNRASAQIHLEKRIPAGGGLGGGSSDAATTLLALNKLWSTGLEQDQLLQLGLQLGADVPLFVKGQSAWAEGVGEALQPVPLAPQCYLVLRPDCAVSTAQVFSHANLTRNTPKMKIAPALRQGSLIGRNDCESVVRQLYPAVDKALAFLSQFGEARLTGTGACIFAAFSSANQAQTVLQQCPAGLQGFITQGIDRSPTVTKLSEVFDPH